MNGTNDALNFASLIMGLAGVVGGVLWGVTCFFLKRTIDDLSSTMKRVTKCERALERISQATNITIVLGDD